MRSAAANALSDCDSGNNKHNGAHDEEIPSPRCPDLAAFDLSLRDPEGSPLNVSGLLVPPVAVPLARIPCHVSSADVLDAEYRAEVFSFWREVALAALLVVGAFVVGVVVTAPLFFPL